MSFNVPLRRSTGLLLLLAVVFVLYLILGAVVFVAIEGPGEQRRIEELASVRKAFLEEHACLQDEDLEAFIAKIIDASNKGVVALKNVTSEPNWSFGQAMFFAGTVVTTIGYGHVTPLSEGGKVFCILYAVCGLPLTLILLSALVERMMIPTNKFLALLITRLGHLFQIFHIRLIHLGIVYLFLIVLFFLIPAAIFSNIETDWNYLDALYYCFISLTTIGLGDFIPGDHYEQTNRALYKILTTLYLLVGLCFMMLSLAVLSEIPELNFGVLFLLKREDDASKQNELSKLASGAAAGKMYSRQEDDDEDSITSGATVDSQTYGSMSNQAYQSAP